MLGGLHARLCHGFLVLTEKCSVGRCYRGNEIQKKTMWQICIAFGFRSVTQMRKRDVDILYITVEVRPTTELYLSTCYTNVNVIRNLHKKLIRSWDSATCEPLDAAERQNSTFLSISRTTGYYDPWRLWHAGSQHNELSCHVPISSFCRTMWSQSTNVTDRQTDRQTSCPYSINRRQHAICMLREKNHECPPQKYKNWFYVDNACALRSVNYEFSKC